MVQSSDVLLMVIAIIFPPAAAGIITGCSCDLMINILLTILGYIPGHIHAFWLIYKRIKAEESFGRAGYTYLGNGQFVGSGAPPPPGGGGYPQQQYGATR